MQTTSAPLVLSQPDSVNLRLNAKSGIEAIRELHAALQSTEGIENHPKFLSDLLVRQSLDSTCLDREVALPHARTAAVNRFVCAVGRSETGIRFDEKHATIHLVILFGAPVGAVSDYLRWLARLTAVIRKPTVQEALCAAPTNEAFLDVWSRHLGKKQ